MAFEATAYDSDVFYTGEIVASVGLNCWRPAANTGRTWSSNMGVNSTWTAQGNNSPIWATSTSNDCCEDC